MSHNYVLILKEGKRALTLQTGTQNCKYCSFMVEIDRLRRLGYRVDLHPVQYINSCILEMCGHSIFSCNMKYLQFNISHSVDPVAQRAVDAVLEASDKFLHARTHLWTWMSIEHQLFKRGDFGPKEYWPFQLDVKPFNLECINCCDILVAKKSAEELKKLDEIEEDELEFVNKY